ncbi:MAG TPA: urease subunit beta [Nitrospirales bacterium]|jgi:urease subunit beta/urease subunit gamma/beta|nr:urease subunit beta [Nitrospirales bacterium]HIA13444.1 urease subunit beta [Nitrospirales bacterium]HIB53762.1 urease subunit beta [Nitrospirales bacterium]HIC05065.1 urease subunit beta [Nitrospirales bacterium]HIN33931.1 urease subunit beta [Nitrospirales bacterium]
MIPGEIQYSDQSILANEGRDSVEVVVSNTGDRPIQVGSHCHFFEVNRALSFEREQAFGMRLNILSGTAVRFEPGEEKTVTLTTLGGVRVVYGINNLTCGKLDDPDIKKESLARVLAQGNPKQL